jgi:two-component system, chemotaxis family, sensor kinase Cph1
MDDEGKEIRCHFRKLQGIARVIAIAMVMVLTALSSRAAAGSTDGALPPADVQVRSADADLAGDGGAVLDFFRKAFDTTEFQPRWRSETWSAAHTWLHIASDLVIAAAYLLMAAVLTHIFRKRAGAPYSSLFRLLALFVFAIGITHLLDALMFWWPAYRLSGLAKAGAALISLVTAAVLVRIAPRVIGLRSPAEIQREIIQRRKTELELRQVHSQLEGVIEQRTAELASKNEEMEQFLNTVSHDLKSPVVTCLGLAGSLREDVRAGRIEETNDTIDRIERSATRMRQLIEDLLNLSRIGKVRFELTEVDTHSVIRSICEEYKPRLAKIGAVLDIETDLPHVRADTHWLTEVFENLITNAMKYGCDDPHPRIVVGCVTNDKEHHFYVRDNGRGIDPAHHALVLEPFKRLRTDKEGSGMGLAIVVRIIKMHGGRIWIESQPGHGATFWVALPGGCSHESSSAMQAAYVETNEPLLSGALNGS